MILLNGSIDRNLIIKVFQEKLKKVQSFQKILKTMKNKRSIIPSTKNLYEKVIKLMKYPFFIDCEYRK